MRRGQGAMLAWIAIAVLGGLWFLGCLDPDIYRLTLADETLYLRNGLNFQRSQFDNYERFPLHSAWYALLQRFMEDPITIFKRGAVLQLSLIVLLLCLASQSLSRLPALALALGFALIATPILGINASPFAQRTALLVLLSGTWLASGIRDPLLRALPLGLAYFVAAFARSEFVLAFYLLSAGLVLYVLALRRTRRDFLILGGYAACIACLSLVMHFPVLAGSERSMMAFGQHYALQLQEQGAAIDPWLQWRAVMQEGFGDSASIQEALAHNPSAFFGHLRWSLGGLWTWVRELHPMSLGLLCLCLGSSAYYLVSLLRGLRRQRVQQREADLVLFACLGLGLLPIMASVLLVAARNHYLQQFYVLSALMGALSIGGLLRQREAQPGPLRGKLGLGLTLGAVLWMCPRPEIHADRNAELAGAMRQLVAPGSAESGRGVVSAGSPRVFSMFRGLSIYIFDQSKEYYFTRWKPETSSLEDYMDEMQFEYVFLDVLRIPKQSELVQQAFESFQANPAGRGYALIHQDARALVYGRLSEPVENP